MPETDAHVDILVTGATGFIGRHLVTRLLGVYSPVNLACLVKPPTTPQEREALATLAGTGVRLIEGDLNDPAVSPQVAPPTNFVFHLAANTDTAASERALAVNDVGTRNLLAWLGGAVWGARIIYSSSIAVLDRDRLVDGPLTESSPCVPRSAYGRTKLRGEQILQTEGRELGYQYTILRLATVYGPGAKTGGLFDRLFALTAKHSLLGRLDWPGRTSIIHVDDVVAIMVGLMQRPEAANEIYCIANPEAPTIGTIAERIGELGLEPAVRVKLPSWIWRLSRRMVWSPIVQIFGTSLAQVAFWRLTLMLDDSFWFDTAKLQAIWSEPMMGLDEGLVRMVAVMMQWPRPPGS